MMAMSANEPRPWRAGQFKKADLRDLPLAFIPPARPHVCRAATCRRLAAALASARGTHMKFFLPVAEDAKLLKGATSHQKVQ
jgi:hypothetical protein